MKRIGRLALVFLMFAILAPCALGKGGSPPGKEKCGHPPGPPQEALKACEGHEKGDKIQITTPLGDTISGTCEDFKGRLALRPDHPPKRKGGDKQGLGPPPD